MKTLKTVVKQLWDTDRPLTAGAIVMLAALLLAAIGLLTDPRTVVGLPIWVKPAKFAMSTAIFMVTMAWIFTYLPAWHRTRKVVGVGTAAILLMEVAIIFIQAWRGTTSHFNVATPFDAVVFAMMGIGIGLQTLLSMAIAVALWKQHFVDRSLGWALRLGLIISIVGASIGGLMVKPTRAQLDEARITHRLPIAGAHTVGAPDGGPGFPALGWSGEHGDLRVPHFLGLHALQLVPLLVVASRRRIRMEDARVRLAFVVSASYFSLFAILLTQALRGQSVLQPDAITLAAVVGWAAISTACAALVGFRRETPLPHALVY
jgi:hypothetical protein